MDTRIARLKEAVEVIRLMWKSSRAEPVSFEGKFYRLAKAWLDQKCVQKPAPPIYIGALGSPRSLRLVGEVVDGFKPWINTPETFRRRLEAVRKAALGAGSDFDAIEKVAFEYTGVTEDPAMRKQALDAIKPELIMCTHKKVLKDMGFEVQSHRLLITRIRGRPQEMRLLRIHAKLPKLCLMKLPKNG